jgi:predicted Ser/Thr protein kinase
MGAVYLARERALERPVAIKVLPPSLAEDADSRERFRREARTAARLTHPNIVPLYTFGDVDGMLYFVMGYVKGEPLGERMRREGRLPPDEVRRIVGELAGALDYAHRQGVIHRDIKPDNVLVDDESGRPMLTDFGVAKARAHGATLTEAGAVVGTAHYMSPEQASGARDLDGRSDLYSLGVMAYTMLAGRLPFEGESFREVLVQQVMQDAPPLEVLVPSAPKELVSAVGRCLAKDPAQRWPDGQALRVALEQSVDDDEDPSRPDAMLRGTVPMVGALMAVDAVFAGASYLIPSLRFEGDSWWVAPVALAGTLIVLPALLASVAHSRGSSWRDIAGFLMEPPRWWQFWYPRRWRGTHDVWDRLPAEIRRFRAITLAAWGMMLVSAGVSAHAMSVRLSGPLDPTAGPISLASAGLALLAVITMLYPVWRLKKWGADRGLTVGEAQKFGLGSTSRFDIWRKPKYAALLLPVVNGTDKRPGTMEPQSPAQFVRAIADASNMLNGPPRELGSEALAAARQAVDALAKIDAEIAVLARDASPVEIAALDQKLLALGEPDNDGPSRRELRQMLASQRDLLARLASQLAAAMRDRERLLDLLRTLWLQVANLRAEMARDERAGSEITGRIRSVVAEIEGYSAAAAILEPRRP